MRSKLPLLVVCFALVVAGSVSGTVGASLSRTDTAARMNEKLPPGVTDDGVENASALVLAHVETVNKSGFVYETRSTQNVSSLGIEARSAAVGVVGAGFSPFRVHSSGAATIGNCTVEYSASQWGNDSLTLSRFQIGDWTQYQREHSNRTANVSERVEISSTPEQLDDAGTSQGALLAAVLYASNFTVVATDTVGSHTLTTLRAAGLKNSINARLGSVNVTNYEVTLTVDERGLMRALTVDATVERGVHRLHHTQEFEALALGVTEPLRPSWTQDALDFVDASVFAGPERSYFEIAHSGGDPVPENSTIEIIHGGRADTLALDEELLPGEAVYVYYPENESSPVISSDPPAADTAQVLDGEYDVNVRTPSDQVIMAATYGINNGTVTSFSSDTLNPLSHCEAFSGGRFLPALSHGMLG